MLLSRQGDGPSDLRVRVWIRGRLVKNEALVFTEKVAGNVPAARIDPAVHLPKGLPPDALWFIEITDHLDQSFVGIRIGGRGDAFDVFTPDLRAEIKGLTQGYGGPN